METTKEIAKILRSTNKMAEAFVASVQHKVGQDVAEEAILTVMQKLNPRSIDMSKVVTAVKREVTRSRRASPRSTNTVVRDLPIRPADSPPRKTTRSRRSPAKSDELEKSTPSKTMIEQMEDILEKNWGRAEREGLQPERLTGPAFVSAVHRSSDPRDATRSRILQACTVIDGQDIVLTPTAVADYIREQL